MMKIEGQATKRKPLQCISNEIQDHRAKQIIKQHAVKCYNKSPRCFTSNNILRSNNSSTKENINSTGLTPQDLSFKRHVDDIKVNDENDGQLLTPNLLVCSERIDDFFEDSIVFYSSDEDMEYNVEFESRLMNMCCMVEYRDEMHKFLKETEIKTRPRSNYMTKQLEITSKMRSIMVDWMVDVVEEFKHDRETLHLSVNYVDRFLSFMAVSRTKLQLVGITALWIAGKFEEIYPPRVKDYAYITDDTYTVEQVIRMEHLMLKVLEFDVAIATSNSFCERYLKEINAPHTTSFLARYLVDLSLLYCEPFLNFLPSEIASSAILLSSFITNEINLVESLETLTSYESAGLKACVYSLYSVYSEAGKSPYQSIKNKYQSEKFDSVANFSVPPFFILSNLI